MKKLMVLIITLSLVFPLAGTTANATYYDLSGITVCIDAGHGGSDSGAVGSLGIYGGTTTVYEKDLTLVYAESIKSALESYGATVIMTRTTDTYVGINARPQFARDNGADCFISVHFDWMPAPSGLLSLYGATRPQDESFSTSIHNGILDTIYVNDRGVKDDTHSAIGSLGVLRYYGDFPRTLIEVNNLDYSAMQGYEMLTEATNYGVGIAKGLYEYYN